MIRSEPVASSGLHIYGSYQPECAFIQIQASVIDLVLCDVHHAMRNGRRLRNP